MRKPLCSGFSCPCAFYIVLFTILFFPCFRSGVSLVVSISLVTCVFKASVFLDELLHSAVCQLGGFTCVFLFACSLLSLSLSVHFFVWIIFHLFKSVWGSLFWLRSFFKQNSLSLFLKSKLLITWTCNITTNYPESQTVSVRLLWFLLLCVYLDTES